MPPTSSARGEQALPRSWHWGRALSLGRGDARGQGARGNSAEQSHGGGQAQPRIRLLFLAHFLRKRSAGRPLALGASQPPRWCKRSRWQGQGRHGWPQPHREPWHLNTGRPSPSPQAQAPHGRPKPRPHVAAQAQAPHHSPHGAAQARCAPLPGDEAPVPRSPPPAAPRPPLPPRDFFGAATATPLGTDVARRGAH